jgi:sugar phosphate isomerase/epimerase
MTCSLTALPRRRWQGIRRPGRSGRRKQAAVGSKGQPQSEAHGARYLLRSAGLAIYLSLAPAAGGLIDEAFAELGRRWKPILDVFDEQGVDLCFEIHPGEDLHDGVTFERFLAAVGGHPRANILYDPSHFVLQQLDYLAFIDIYHERIRAFHVKDAEFNPNGRSGVYGGYQDWIDRPGRFRSLGDGQVDFGGIFSKLAQYDFPGWAVMEWECALKHPEDGAREGAPFIRDHIIRVTEHAFDDFAGGQADRETNRRLLGL